MITTVTLNPMLDKTVRVDSLKKGKIHRAESLEMIAGGKGINVARQLNRLGVSVVATGFLGGPVGKMVEELLTKEGLAQDFVDSGVMTREGVTYVEKDGTSTAIFEPSGKIPDSSVQTLQKRIRSFLEKSSWVVCSGSSPCADTDGVYYEAIVDAQKANVKTVLDTYGKAFIRGLEAVPTMIKPNHHEYESTFDTKLRSEKNIRKAMELCLNKGVRFVVFTNGAKPAYAASEEGQWKIRLRPVKAVNAVGSGDTMVAGILFGMEKGWAFEQCLQFGCAAGAANASVWEVANSTLEAIESFRQRVSIERLN